MKTKNKDGYIMGLTMIILLILGFFGAGTLSSGTHRALAVARNTQDAQAFWAAEGGLEYAKALLENAGYKTVDGALPDDITINGFTCSYETLADSDDIYTTYLYATVESDSGKTIQLKLACTQDSITKYAWGAFTAGAWNTWGRDRVGGTNGVNTAELTIQWGPTIVVGGPFCNYDILFISTDEMNLGYTSALNFFSGNATAKNSTTFYQVRDGGDPDEESLGSTAASVVLDNTALYTALPNGFEYLGCYDTVMANRNTGSGGAVYDDAPVGTIVATARTNYLNITSSTTPLVTASGSDPENVYEIEFNGNTYDVYEGSIHLEASVTKGVYERKRAGSSYLSYVRYYMDMDEDSSMDIQNGSSRNSAEDLIDVLGNNEDLPIFLNPQFQRDNDTPVASGTISSNTIIYIDADLYISGTIDGYLTLAGADNIYIAPEGITYESAPDPNWENWDTKNADLASRLSTAGFDSLETAIKTGDNLSNFRDELSDWMDDNLTDMLTLMAKRQVIMLGDDTEEADINVHAATLIPWDVDPNFGQDMRITLENGLFSDGTNTFTLNTSDPIYKALAYSNLVDGLYYNDADNKWTYGETRGNLTAVDSSIGIEEINKDTSTWYYYGDWEGFKKGYKLDNLKKRGESTSGLADEFYKDYVTNGFSPWDKYCKKNTSQCNIFGGMLEYRHSRYNPTGKGPIRNFIYDWRLLNSRTEAIESEGYSFSSWNRVPSSEVYVPSYSIPGS